MHYPSLQEGSGAEHDTDDGIPEMPLFYTTIDCNSP